MVEMLKRAASMILQSLGAEEGASAGDKWAALLLFGCVVFLVFGVFNAYWKRRK